MKHSILLFVLWLIFILPSSVFAVTGSITGRVTNGTNGIAGASVWVYATDGTQVLGVSTDTNGYYTVSGISSGTYKVYFLGVFGGYINQWFSNKTDFTLADAVAVNAPDSTSGIDAVLSAGGAIAGTVTDGTNPIPNIGVWVYDNSSSCNVIEKTSTNFNGEYAIGGLPSGNYKVFFNPGSTGYVGEWYNNKFSSCASADSVTVTAQSTTTLLNAVLILTGGLAGRVTDVGTNGIYGVTVGIYDNSSSCVLKATSSTNLNGDYAIGGLPSGDYKVFFFATSVGFMNEWYDNQTSCASATSVTVTDPNTLQNIDAVLSSLYRTITVSMAGTGSGTVMSTPPAINCGLTCSTSFTLGTQVDLSADAASGSFFNGWSGSGVCSGNASPCNLTIGDDNAVTASFDTYADFVANPFTGGAPLFVNFTDQSLNNPTSWTWNFGDSGASTLQNPIHKYVSPGTYSVTLSNTGPIAPSSLTKNNYITVLPCVYDSFLIGGLPYASSSIQDAYNYTSGDVVIEIQALDFTGDLLFDKDNIVTLEGGFDCPFGTNTGQYTTVVGKMTVGSGTGEVIIDNIVIR